MLLHISGIYGTSTGNEYHSGICCHGFTKTTISDNDMKKHKTRQQLWTPSYIKDTIVEQAYLI